MVSGRPVVPEMFEPASEVEIINTRNSTGLRGPEEVDGREPLPEVPSPLPAVGDSQVVIVEKLRIVLIPQGRQR